MSWLGRLFDGIRGKRERTWAGSVEDLLFDGESVRQRVGLGGDDRVVVTTHRLLSFTPGSDGENYRGVDLPNVTGVRAGHEGERNLLWTGGRLLLYGGVVLAVGVFVDFESFVPTDAFQQTGAAGRLGMGGLLAMLQQFLDVVARVDEFARLIGAALVLFAVFVFAVYLVTRDRVLVVGVAGDEDDVRVPAADDALDAAVADLEVALFDTGATVASDGAEASEARVEADPGASATSGGESDPLAPDSGAVRSDGLVRRDEATPSEADAGVGDDETGVSDAAADAPSRAGEPAEAADSLTDVERAVRETSQTDFSETVDRVVEGPTDDADADDGGHDDSEESDDGEYDDTAGSDFEFGA